MQPVRIAAGEGEAAALSLHPVFAHPAVAASHEAACAPFALAGSAVAAVQARLARRADLLEAQARSWSARLGLRRAR